MPEITQPSELLPPPHDVYPLNSPGHIKPLKELIPILETQAAKLGNDGHQFLDVLKNTFVGDEIPMEFPLPTDFVAALFRNHDPEFDSPREIIFRVMNQDLRSSIANLPTQMDLLPRLKASGKEVHFANKLSAYNRLVQRAQLQWPTMNWLTKLIDQYQIPPKPPEVDTARELKNRFTNWQNNEIPELRTYVEQTNQAAATYKQTLSTNPSGMAQDQVDAIISATNNTQTLLDIINKT